MLDVGCVRGRGIACVAQLAGPGDEEHPFVRCLEVADLTNVRLTDERSSIRFAFASEDADRFWGNAVKEEARTGKVDGWRSHGQ